MAAGLSPRTKRRDAAMASADNNEDEATKKRSIRPIKGLSRARIAGGRLWLRLRTNPAKTVFAPVAVIAFFLITMTLFQNLKLPSTMRTTVQASPYEQRPCMVQMHNFSVSRLELEFDWSPPPGRPNKYWTDHGSRWYKPRSKVKDGCVPLSDWQESQHPSCNSFHEVSMSQLVHPDGWELTRLINNGAYRDVWGIRDYDGERRVLKTLRYKDNRAFDQRNFDRHRRDAVAAEQLSASPYIVDIFGYCANSAIYDYCDGGDLYDVFESEPTKNELLRIAHDVAASVADAHHYDSQGRATIAHTDLKPNQWVNLNGRYQLNDFNRCRFLSWDPEKDETCGFQVQRNAGVWRAPEEYKHEAETEKLDVFSLGNVLYFLLTKSVPFESMESSDAYDYVAEGGRVEVKDENILNSTHPFDKAMLKAMDMCFVYDPKERPSARQVANVIKSALDRIPFQDK